MILFVCWKNTNYQNANLLAVLYNRGWTLTNWKSKTEVNFTVLFGYRSMILFIELILNLFIFFFFFFYRNSKSFWIVTRYAYSVFFFWTSTEYYVITIQKALFSYHHEKYIFFMYRKGRNYHSLLYITRYKNIKKCKIN